MGRCLFFSSLNASCAFSGPKKWIYKNQIRPWPYYYYIGKRTKKYIIIIGRRTKIFKSWTGKEDNIMFIFINIFVRGACIIILNNEWSEYLHKHGRLNIIILYRIIPISEIIFQHSRLACLIFKTRIFNIHIIQSRARGGVWKKKCK